MEPLLLQPLIQPERSSFFLPIRRLEASQKQPLQVPSGALLVLLGALSQVRSGSSSSASSSESALQTGRVGCDEGTLTPPLAAWMTQLVLPLLPRPHPQGVIPRGLQGLPAYL